MPKHAPYQKKDRLYHQAKTEGYRSRAAYKLLELNQKYRLIRKGQVILDLGTAPGSWAQVACQLVGKKGVVIGIDLVSVEPGLPGNFQFIEGDILASKTRQHLEQCLASLKQQRVDLIISDMAPKLTGVKLKDEVQSIEVAEMAFDYAKTFLNNQGALLIKTFPSQSLQDFRRTLKPFFKQHRLVELDASRKTSREQYILETGFKTNAVGSNS